MTGTLTSRTSRSPGPSVRVHDCPRNVESILHQEEPYDPCRRLSRMEQNPHRPATNAPDTMRHVVWSESTLDRASRGLSWVPADGPWQRAGTSNGAALIRSPDVSWGHLATTCDELLRGKGRHSARAVTGQRGGVAPSRVPGCTSPSFTGRGFRPMESGECGRVEYRDRWRMGPDG